MPSRQQCGHSIRGLLLLLLTLRCLCTQSCSTFSGTVPTAFHAVARSDDDGQYLSVMPLSMKWCALRMCGCEQHDKRGARSVERRAEVLSHSVGWRHLISDAAGVEHEVAVQPPELCRAEGHGHGLGLVRRHQRTEGREAPRLLHTQNSAVGRPRVTMGQARSGVESVISLACTSS